MTSFSIFRQHWKKLKKNLNKVLNTLENIMEKRAFAPMEQMLHFPWYFHMKKVNKQCLLDTPRTVRVSEKTWQVIVQTSMKAPSMHIQKPY